MVQLALSIGFDLICVDFRLKSFFISEFYRIQAQHPENFNPGRVRVISDVDLG